MGNPQFTTASEPPQTGLFAKKKPSPMPTMPNSKRAVVGLVAVGLTCSGMVAFASPAAAATVATWDRVAKCESGGRWNINTGNGYYGGLQFSYRTWLAYGGGKYARTANKATKRQQIGIAERVLNRQGPGAWGDCAVRAGLTRNDDRASRTKPRPPAKAKPRSVRAWVTVKPGDTLGKIGAKWRVSWQSIYQANRNLVKNPNVIHVGWVLRIPK